jgi:hypothetical protein
MDGVTPHVCKKIGKQQQPASIPAGGSTEVSKEIAAIKAQLLVLVSRLDHLQRELQK